MPEVFEGAVKRVFAKAQLDRTFADPRRQLGYGPYLSLFLFGLFNPVVESMRGLCSVSPESFRGSGEQLSGSRSHLFGVPPNGSTFFSH